MFAGSFQRVVTASFFQKSRASSSREQGPCVDFRRLHVLRDFAYIFSQNIQSELSSDVPSSSHRPNESVLTGDHDVENEVDLMRFPWKSSKTWLRKS